MDVVRRHTTIIGKSKSNYMFWLHKATIIRPHVSENEKRKLYGCSYTYNHKIYDRHLALMYSICERHIWKTLLQYVKQYCKKPLTIKLYKF